MACDGSGQAAYRKIAVLRANAIGDFLFSLPALEALRARYPQAEIVLLGLTWHAEFLAGRPSPIDRVSVLPPVPGLTVPAETPIDRAELDAWLDAQRRERFDLAIQMHGGGRHSNPLLRALEAACTIGLKAPDAVALDRCVPYVYFQNEVQRYLEVAALAGAAPVCLQPRLTPTAADLAESCRVLPPGPRPRVALHSGAGDPRRRWPVEQFAALGDALAESGAEVLLLGAAHDRTRVAQVAAHMRHVPIDVCGQLSLGGLAGLLSRCRVVVGNDSGPLHLAAAVGAATVGIYWCGNVITAAPAFRTRHRLHIAWQLACPQCGRDCTRDDCRHAVSFVADVPLAEVLTSTRELLDEDMAVPFGQSSSAQI